jgi:hypothetical protein
MANPLNSYATKVFAEQPLALWALDEPVDYISLIPADGGDFSLWTTSGVSAIGDATDPEFFDVIPPAAPFLDEPVYGIIAEDTNNGIVTFASSFQLQPEDFSSNIKTFAFATYVYTYSKILNVKIGYKYIDPVTLEEMPEVLKPATIASSLAWSFVSESFTLPESFADLELLIKIEYAFSAEPYELVLNGLTAGQWSEEFHLESSGIDKFNTMIDVPSSIDVPASKAIEAYSYGFDAATGYYLVDENYLYSRNNGVPLVYGSANSTKVLPKDNSPSIILPGFGFLNESGVHNELTAEFWCNVESNAVEPRKIFGPISSDDGIYCEGPFIKTKVGPYSNAHYVGHWNRPMLIDFTYSPSRISLIINGDTVISQAIDSDLIDFPLRTDDGVNQDWLGFYAYSDVPSILIDSVGIYPYEVPSIVAKRRFAYGQAVEYPSNVKGLNAANSMLVDFAFSKYSKNYYFPSSASWEGGLLENIDVRKENLVMPNHSLPLTNFSDKDENTWLSDLELAQTNDADPFITLRPNSEWSSTEGYLYYQSLNFLQEDTKAFYALFETSADSETKEVLFELSNDLTKSILQVYLLNNEINYVLLLKQADGTYSEDLLYKALGQKVGDRFLVGLDIDRFVKYYGNKVTSFFGTKQKTRIFVGGSPTLQDTFNGKIFRVSFCNARNLVKIKHFFSERGVPIDYENVFSLFTGNIYDAGDEYFGNDENYWPLILDGGDPYDFVTIKTTEHIATYTLMAKNELGNFRLDIAANSYWENYVPLSYFAKNVPDAFGNQRRKLDFVQINLDSLKVFDFDGIYYNTNGLPVKAYVSLQPLAAGANALLSSFSRTQKLENTNVVSPGAEWINTRYEVVDGTVITFPTDISFEDFSLNVHLDIQIEGIYSNPFKLKSLQLSSQAFGAFPNKIGSKFGTDIVPYTRRGTYFEYQNAPEFSIYKGSTPYLYLTDNSGIRLSGKYLPSPSKGLSMAINKNAASFYKLSNIQMCLRYDEELMPQAPVKIFELKSAEQTTAFYLISDSVDRTRGQIYAVNEDTKRIQANLFFFVNGKPVRRGILYPRSWAFLSISFPDPLSFSETVGALRFTSPIMFNNVSLYETTVADDEERYGFRQWFSVRNAGGQDFDWGYWAGKELVGDEVIVIPDAGFTWQEVLFLAASQKTEVDAEIIYKIFTGTSKFLVGDDNVLTLNNYQYKFTNNIGWSQYSAIAV